MLLDIPPLFVRKKSEGETDLYNFVSVMTNLSDLTESCIALVSAAFPLALLALSVNIRTLSLRLENEWFLDVSRLVNEHKVLPSLIPDPPLELNAPGMKSLSVDSIDDLLA